jgi:predicted membrane protein
MVFFLNEYSIITCTIRGLKSLVIIKIININFLINFYIILIFYTISKKYKSWSRIYLKVLCIIFFIRKSFMYNYSLLKNICLMNFFYREHMFFFCKETKGRRNLKRKTIHKKKSSHYVISKKIADAFWRKNMSQKVSIYEATSLAKKSAH